MTGDDSFEVWDATGDELDDVRWLLARANEEHRSVLPPSAFDPYLALVLDLEARTDAASLLVVRAHGRPIGTVTWFADAEAEGWGAPTGVSGLRAMAVDPTRRREGIGTALVTACVRRSRIAGARALTLHAAAWLHESVHLYEQCGFVARSGA